MTANTASNGARVLLTGTFFADNWVEAHVRPLAASSRVEHVWVVSDRAFVPVEKVTYVSAPTWIQKTVGRVPARSLWVLLTALRTKPHVIGGFHLLFNGLLVLLVARLMRAKAMYFCVGGWVEFAKGGVYGGNHVFNLIGREDPVLEAGLLRAVRQFDLILTMGTRAREYLLAQGITCPVRVMSGGIDPQRFFPLEPAPTYDLITVSRLESVKRLDIFLEVVRRVAEKVPNVRAVMVGDGGEMESLMRLAAEKGIADRVDFPGRQQNVEQWLAKSRVFVLTSDSEGLALAVMEAMTAGLPAVVSDVGDLADLVQDGANGWLVTPGHVNTFVEKTTDLLTDERKYGEFSRQARRSAAVYSVEVMRRHWGAILAAWEMGESSQEPGCIAQRRRQPVLSRKRLWERSQSLPLPAVAKRVLSSVPPGIWLGRRFRRMYRETRRTEFLSQDELNALQLERVRGMVQWAYCRSPYYRLRFRESGFHPNDLRTLDDLKQLPTIDQAEVRRHLAALRTFGPLARGFDMVSTGGTGGNPLRFEIDANRSAFEYSHLVASWERAGYRISMPMAVLRGRVIPPDESGLRYRYDPLLRHHYYSVFHLSDENMRRYLEHIATLGDCFLHVYPSAVDALARFVQRGGAQAPTNIRGIIAESENIYPDQRVRVERVFNARMLCCYGHTEKVVCAAECEHAHQYHVWPSYGYCELLDEQGIRITTPGRRGEIVGTGFINTAVPFIRYRTGDFATYVGQGCNACGRQHMILADITGHRTQEVLVARDGAEIAITSINMHDDTFNHVLRYQFYQDTPGRVVLRVEVDANWSRLDAKRIHRNLGRKWDGNIEMTIQVVDEIPVLRSGKFVYVDQKITPSLRLPMSIPACVS